MERGAWLVIAVVVSLLAVSAHAQTGDLVLLPNGGRLRGTVTEYEPGQRVVITMADGSTRSLGPGEFSSVTFADASATLTPSAPDPTPTEALPDFESGSIPEDAPTLAPATPPAPSPEAVGEHWGRPRSFAGPRDDDWDNVALRMDERTPRGHTHFGLQAEGGFALLMAPSPIGDGAVGGSFFGDITIDGDQTFRIGFFGDYFGTGENYVPQFGGRTTAYDYGGGAFGVRLLFGFDFGEMLAFRFGIEGGLMIPTGPLGGTMSGRLEFVTRLLDSRSLELGVAVLGGFQSAGLQYDALSMFSYRGSTFVWVLPQVQAFVSWVFE
jgi:hypothetical protein